MRELLTERFGGGAMSEDETNNNADQQELSAVITNEGVLSVIQQAYTAGSPYRPPRTPR